MLFLCFFFPGEKLWKRICSETSTEINLLLENWKYIIGGLIFQVQEAFLIPAISTSIYIIYVFTVFQFSTSWFLLLED